MIERIKKLIVLGSSMDGEVARELAETVVNIVVAEIVGDIRSVSIGDKACGNCLEVRRRAIDIVLSKSPTL